MNIPDPNRMEDKFVFDAWFQDGERAAHNLEVREPFVAFKSSYQAKCWLAGYDSMKLKLSSSRISVVR